MTQSHKLIALGAGVLLFMGVVGESALTFADHTDSARLGNIPSFEVNQMRIGFQTDQQFIHPEMTDYLTRALADIPNFPIKSPAQGFIELSCKGMSCGTIVLKVKDGKSGPVVWETSKHRFHALRVAEKDDRKVAQELADALAQAYQQSQP